MSDTPETQEAVERWRQGKINIFDEMARLERERDKAQALVAEKKQAIIWAKAEAKERLHRLDQAACERRTWLEAHEKMKLERDEIAALVRRLFQLLETVEVSDSEREFHPTRIQSCRVMHTIELGELLPKLKEAAK